MAKTDEEIAAMEQELATSKKQLHELLAKAKTEEGEKKKENERNASPGKVTVDPDLAKEILELKLKVAKLEGQSKGAGGSFELVDLFK